MSTSVPDNNSPGAGAHGGASAYGGTADPAMMPGRDREYSSVTDAIPDADPLHGAQGSYDKGEVGSIGALISDITDNLSQLMRQEVALAKAELQESARSAGKGAGMLGGAGLAGYFVLLFLSIALWWWLGDLFGHGWSALVVAILWAIVAAVLAVLGRKRLSDVKGIPQTVATAQRVPEALKGNETDR